MKLSNLFNILFLNAFVFIFVSCETPVEEIETDRNALSATESSEAFISKSEEQPSAKEAEEVDEININDLAESELPGCAENFPTQALGQNNGFNLSHNYGKLPIDETSFARTIFNDVEGLHGQGWVNTEALSFSEDKLIQIWSNSTNSRMLKGYSSRPVSIAYPGNNHDFLYFNNLGGTANSESLKLERTLEGNCHNSYYATTYLKAGNSISFSILNSMYGNRINSAVIAVDGIHYLFKAHSKDYTVDGGHNLASYFTKGYSRVNGRVKTYQCSGNVIQVKSGKNFGCKDHAQRNYGIKCFEEDYSNDKNECRFYDGAIERGPDSTDYIQNIYIGYFMEQESYFKDQVLQ